MLWSHSIARTWTVYNSQCCASLAGSELACCFVLLLGSGANCVLTHQMAHQCQDVPMLSMTVMWTNRCCYALWRLHPQVCSTVEQHICAETAGVSSHEDIGGYFLSTAASLHGCAVDIVLLFLLFPIECLGLCPLPGPPLLRMVTWTKLLVSLKGCVCTQSCGCCPGAIDYGMDTLSFEVAVFCSLLRWNCCTYTRGS